MAQPEEVRFRLNRGVALMILDQFVASIQSLYEAIPETIRARRCSTLKLATQNQLTRKYEIANEIVEASVLNRAEIAKGLASVADAMVARIMAAADVPRSVKEDLVTDLAGVPLILENTARSQTKLRQGGNGNGSEY